MFLTFLRSILTKENVFFDDFKRKELSLSLWMIFHAAFEIKCVQWQYVKWMIFDMNRSNNSIRLTKRSIPIIKVKLILCLYVFYFQSFLYNVGSCFWIKIFKVWVHNMNSTCTHTDYYACHKNDDLQFINMYNTEFKINAFHL